LRRFLDLKREAVEAVTARFYSTFPSLMIQFGEHGRQATREDLVSHLEFLQPVIELGILQPLGDYLRWMKSILGSRNIPTTYLPLSLDWFAEFFSSRLPAEDAAIVGAALEAGKSALQAANGHSATYLRGMPEPWKACDAFEAELLAGQHKKACATYEESIEASHDLVETSLHLVQPALYRIGQKWQENRISVSREHLATAIAQSILARGYSRAQPAQPRHGRVVLAGIAGNYHALGLTMVADALELQGWEVFNLGANNPTESIVTLVRETGPKLVGLSVSLPRHFSAARKTIAQLTAQGEAGRPRIMLGGVAINQFAPLARLLGADAAPTDAKEAVQFAQQLLGSQ
jgi:methanogenic corrinoid protein MtbC1